MRRALIVVVSAVLLSTAEPWGVIRISDTDPWWVSGLLLVGRSIPAAVLAVWIASMVRKPPRGTASPRTLPWRLCWHWTFTGWLTSVWLIDVAGIARVLLVGYIRGGDEAGQWYRGAEVFASLYFAAWSILGYLSWTNPDEPHPGPEETPE